MNNRMMDSPVLLAVNFCVYLVVQVTLSLCIHYITVIKPLSLINNVQHLNVQLQRYYQFILG